MKRLEVMIRVFSLMCALLVFSFQSVYAQSPGASEMQLTHATEGKCVGTPGGELTITCVARRCGYGKGDMYDADILSPKSAIFSADGRKLYVNSLEGCRTVVYDALTRRKIKTIDHKFENSTGDKWLPLSGFYTFTHYADGASRAFYGKPVEAALSADGRYLFVPYYRRSFDINAQDPSALAVIDTRIDEIVLMTETGLLPKMVCVSNSGKLLAITHWGDNTVGFLDISASNPAEWRHQPPVTIGTKFIPDYSLTEPVNRDSGSGFLLRGTVFLPGDSLLLVSGMGGSLYAVDVNERCWIGSMPAFTNVRHIVRHGDMLYMTRNVDGEVLSVPVENVVAAIRAGRNASRTFSVKGIRRVKVGTGARTLQVSPSGKYIFVACNTASALYVVRTADMSVIGTMDADAFPVGLAVSPDGSMVVTTSQGRKGRGGGNAVDFFRVEYAEPEIVPELSGQGGTVPPDSVGSEETVTAVANMQQASPKTMPGWVQVVIAVLLVMLTVMTALLLARRHSRRRED